MNRSFSILLSLLSAFLFSISWEAAASHPVEGSNFFQCLSLHSKSFIPLYTKTNSSYSTILQATIDNLRCYSPTTPKPLVIITPLQESHIQTAVFCSRRYGLQVRVRSGGHDYEGLSYVADSTFIMIDMTNFREIDVNTEDNTAWVQAGSILGELYYKIAEKSKYLGFSAGLCPTIGVGGHFSGGGFGPMVRKYGVAADHIIDARMVDCKGRILTRATMGEDLFWAIRGGGGASFGVIISYKINLVAVPPTVTTFSVSKTLEEGASKLLYRYQQVIDKLHEDLFIRVSILPTTSKSGNSTILVAFNCLFLGGAKDLLPLITTGFPELGVGSNDFKEMSWLQSVVFFAGYTNGESTDILLNRTPQFRGYFKAKSDFVKEPIPESVLENLWQILLEGETFLMFFLPFGGKMNKIPESAIPFPHRKGNIYNIQYVVRWTEQDNPQADKHIAWIRKLYDFMAPYVSKNPREAYLNYRDLDLGRDGSGETSYSQAVAWGSKYFKNNFNRLLHVKTKADPGNFFRNEQSIPPLRMMDVEDVLINK
ncbi:berberine bridge enzyme-like 26 [Macadamia integrifolia]|uniref:berberine bridge enzyme-like 26 n=1 Tax=Macadamia integrifolia TaxID=60698 RepID=UPI001C4F1FC7|nr:berberine bridge enzyme-like 26 [Macadamia integrifolia]